MSKQHFALLLPAVGADFTVGTRATPTPGPGQVLVRNKAVALNPIERLVKQTGFLIGEYGFPAVVGSDGAGEIAALGPDVAGWKTGDRVLYQSWYNPDRGTFQEFTIADAVRVAKIPDDISFESAATVPLTLATAAIGAYKERASTLRPNGHDLGGAGLTPPWEAGGRGKYAGKVALVLGGSSSVGRFAIQLAKLSGFSTIITTASKRNEAYCKDAGATHVIDYKNVPYADLPAALHKIVGDEPIAYIYDAASSPESQKTGWGVLSAGGAMVVVLPPSPEIHAPGKDDEKGRRLVSVFGNFNDPDNQEFGKGLYAKLTELLEKGELKPNQPEVVGQGLDAISAGLDKLGKGISGVKLVVTL
ncbi:unnamed protein product [Peniophora sp. CBMAI 1063]|nr:unnamed protein product [Peniophora sp. CBMAI 1063]